MRAGLSRSYIYTSDQLADEVITETKIANGAVTTYKINYGSIQPDRLGYNIVRSRAKAYLSADQSYSAGTDTKVRFDTKVFDPMGDYDNVTNYRYTVEVAFIGQFVIHAQVQVAGHGSANVMALYIEKNGSLVHRKVYSYAAESYGFTLDITAVLDLVAGDYIEIFVNDGLAGTIKGGSDKTFLEIFRLP
jgi:hypothetical protein